MADMRCGHIGCCDNSPNRHATADWHEKVDHPLIPRTPEARSAP